MRKTKFKTTGLKMSLTEALETKQGKYFLARKKGGSKMDAALQAGYSVAAAKIPGRIEGSQTYQHIQASYKDKLLSKISLDEITDEHIKIIKQDDDRGTKLRAIELAVDKIEPDKVVEEDEDRVLIVLSNSL